MEASSASSEDTDESGEDALAMMKTTGATSKRRRCNEEDFYSLDYGLLSAQKAYKWKVVLKLLFSIDGRLSIRSYGAGMKECGCKEWNENKRSSCHDFRYTAVWSSVALTCSKCEC